MSRQQLLFKLLEKAEKGNQYIYSQLYQMTQSSSPPATIKRMQILQMGSCKINGPIPKANQQPIIQKQNSVNNRRVLVLQKVRNYTKIKEADKKNGEELNFTKRIKNQIIMTSHTQSVEQKTNDTAQTEAQSPLRYGFTVKKSLCLSESTRNNKMKNQIQANLNNKFKSEKNCIYKSIELQYESARTEKQKQSIAKRHLSNKSRVRKQSQTSFSNIRNDEKMSRVLFKKQVNKNYQKPISPPPKISAKSYVVYQILQTSDKQIKQNIKVHIAYNSKIRSQIASLTKIMTCIVAIEICDRFNLNPNTQEIKIGKFESSIGGTTANIQIDDIYTLNDLLHGLMLPSGNDASLAIAVWGGKKLIQYKEKMQGQIVGRKKMKKECYQRFIQQMNAKAQSLGLTKTNYANSHGLVNILNKSCAHDVAILSHYCIKNLYFSKIVSCKQYKITIRVETKIKLQNVQESKKKKENVKITYDQQQQYSDLDSQTSSQVQHLQEQKDAKQRKLQKQIIQQKIVTTYKDVFWQNTHKLLHKNPEQYLGIKTGITTSAGPCLSSCVLTPCGRKLFIVVLNCKKIQMRFKQTQILKKWVYKKQGILKKNLASKESKSEFELSDKQQQQSIDLAQNSNEIFD